MNRGQKLGVLLLMPAVLTIVIIACLSAGIGGDGDNLNEQTGLYECPRCDWIGEASDLEYHQDPDGVHRYHCPECDAVMLRGEVQYER